MKLKPWGAKGYTGVQYTVEVKSAVIQRTDYQLIKWFTRALSRIEQDSGFM